MIEALKRWWSGRDKKPTESQREVLRLLAHYEHSSWTEGELLGTSHQLDRDTLRADLRRMQSRGWVTSRPYMRRPERTFYSYEITVAGWDAYRRKTGSIA